MKAAKLSAKKPVVDEQTMNGFQAMWTIRQQDLAAKSMLSKMSLLEGLIGKKEHLSECEETLKKKLISDLMSN